MGRKKNTVVLFNGTSRPVPGEVAPSSLNGGTSKTVSQISLRLVVYGDSVAGQVISIPCSSQEN